DELLANFVAERDLLHEISPGVPVTTNVMVMAATKDMDYWSWAQEMDVVSNDHYPIAADPDNHRELAFSADLTRGLAGGRPWLLMEQATSAVNWQPRNIVKRPGELLRNSLQHVARGADAILFFQWRASRSGAEKFHSAMLPHAGTSSRVWREVAALGKALGRLGELRGSRAQAQVAILWDWESFWAQDLEWRPSEDLSHRERISAFYDRLWRDGLTTDFAHPEQDLSRYRLVIAPASYLLTRASAANLARYVAGGGTVLVSCFSGIVDEHDAVHPGGFGAALRTVLGLTVEEFLPLRRGEIVHLDTGDLVGDVWADDLALEGADVVGSFLDGPAAGQPCLTRHRHGAGHGWYLATRIDVAGLAEILRPVYLDAGIGLSGLPEELEVVVRHGPRADYTVAINHGTAAAVVPGPGEDLLTGEGSTTSFAVAPGGARVVRAERDARDGFVGR
ncbi:MAG: beta-galactosidase trimerization domain-containing protein, partial [Cellulomonas sp.]|nr:beta-galactosidase trimerization domain-containing protein [Cellulomonas sp.]